MEENESEQLSQSELQSKRLTEVISLVFVTLILLGITIKILFF